MAGRSRQLAAWRLPLCWRTPAEANLATCYSPFFPPAYGHIVSFPLCTTFYPELQHLIAFQRILHCAMVLKRTIFLVSLLWYFPSSPPIKTLLFLHLAYGLLISVVSSNQNLALLAFGLWPITFRRLSCNQILACLAMANGLLLVFSLAVLALAASGPAIPWHAEKRRDRGHTTQGRGHLFCACATSGVRAAATAQYCKVKTKKC